MEPTWVSGAPNEKDGAVAAGVEEVSEEAAEAGADVSVGAVNEKLNELLSVAVVPVVADRTEEEEAEEGATASVPNEKVGAEEDKEVVPVLEREAAGVEVSPVEKEKPPALELAVSPPKEKPPAASVPKRDTENPHHPL